MDYKAIHYLSWIIGFLVLLFTLSIKNGVVVFLYLNLIACLVFLIVSLKRFYIRKTMKIERIKGSVKTCGVVPIKTQLYGIGRIGATSSGITDAFYNYLVLVDQDMNEREVLISLWSQQEFSTKKEAVVDRTYNDNRFCNGDEIEVTITSFNNEKYILKDLAIELYDFKQS